MDKKNATPKSKASKRRLTRCDLRLICALLEDAGNRPKLDGVDGKTKAGIRPVVQTKAYKELADFIKTKRQLNNVRKKSKSSKEKKHKKRLTRHDIYLLCTWLENGDNRSKVHGVDGKTRGIRPVDRAKAYKELADFINKNHSKDSACTSSLLTGDSMRNRFCHLMKRFRDAREIAESKGFGLTDVDREMNISTIQDKLENLCPGFNRLGTMFGFPPSVNSDVTEGIGVGIYSSTEGMVPFDSNDSAAVREMDHGTEENPVMMRWMDYGTEAKPLMIRKLDYGTEENPVMIGEDDEDRRTQEDKEAEQAIVKMNLQIAMISSHRPLDEMKEILKICQF